MVLLILHRNGIALEHPLYFMESIGLLAFISIGHYLEARTTAAAGGALRSLLELQPDEVLRVNPDDGEDGRAREPQQHANDLQYAERNVLEPLRIFLHDDHFGEDHNDAEDHCESRSTPKIQTHPPRHTGRNEELSYKEEQDWYEEQGEGPRHGSGAPFSGKFVGSLQLF